MLRMHNPAHPGELLREYLDVVTVSDLARHISVSTDVLQQIIDCTVSISADMAYRLGEALGTTPELWAGMQLQYDLYQAGNRKRPKIERIPMFTQTGKDSVADAR